MTEETKADFAPDPEPCPECGSYSFKIVQEEDHQAIVCLDCGHGEWYSSRPERRRL